MILFLTYHKVLRGSESQPEFYTLRAEALERHLELLHARGLRPMKVSELTSLSQSSNGTADAGPTPFLLSFDDGTVDHYEVVYPLLARAKHSAIFFVPTAKVNRPGYLTNEMIREMVKAGHTIGLHGHEHRRMDEFSEEDIRVQMEVSRKTMTELTGFAPDVFAPPGGYMDNRVQSIALEAGVRAIRTMHWGFNRWLNPAKLECIPLHRHTKEAEFHRVLEFRSQALAYTAKQIARKLVPPGMYAILREKVSRLRS